MVDAPRPVPPEITAALAQQNPSGRDQPTGPTQQNFRPLGEKRDTTGPQGFRRLGSTGHPDATPPAHQTQRGNRPADSRDQESDRTGSEVTDRRLPPGHPVIPTRKLDDLRGPKERRVPLKKSVRRGRADIPRTPYQILDPEQSFATRGEMLRARAAGRKQAIADTKEERNTLLAFAIEDIWGITGNHRRDFVQRGSGSGIGAIRINESGEVTERIPITRRERTGGLSAAQLRRQTEHMLMASTTQWVGERVRETPYDAPDETLSVDGKNYRRLSELAGIINSSTAAEAEFTPLSPTILLRGGVETAANAFWGLYDVIKPVYLDQYKTAPTKNDFDELFDSANDIAAAIAAGQLTIAIGMLGHLTQTENPHQQVRGRTLKPSDFTVQEEMVKGPEGGMVTKKKLVIKEEAFAAYEELLNTAIANNSQDHGGLRRIDENTTGCPALPAEGTGPISEQASDSAEIIQGVVTEMGVWCKAVAQEHLDAYLEAA